MTSFYDVLKSREYLIIDTETTGLTEDAELCSLAVIDAKGKMILNRLVKTVHPIPAQASAIHGITDQTVSTSPTWLDLKAEFEAVVKGRELVIYNAAYDLRIIRQTYAAHGLTLPVLNFRSHCAMEVFAVRYGDWNDYHNSFTWQKLSTAAEFYGAATDDAHDALADCKMTLAVCEGMLREYEEAESDQ